MSIRNKMVAMLVLPFLVILCFAALEFNKVYQHHQSVKVTEHVLHMIKKVDSLKLALQRERGLSHGVINGKNSFIAESLRLQRLETDSEIQRFQKTMDESLSDNGYQLNQALDDLFEAFLTISDLRRQTDSGTDVFEQYTQLIERTLYLNTLSNKIFGTASSVQLEKYFNLYLDLDHWLELAGRERGYSSGVRVLHDFTPELKLLIEAMESQQEVYIARILAHPNFQEIYQDRPLKTVEAFETVNQLRQQRTKLFNLHQYIHNMTPDLGFGGFIHHFKNAVLRGQVNYKDLFNGSASKYTTYIEQLLTLTENQQINQQLKRIDGVFSKYVINFNKLPHLERQGLSVEERDRLVKVDDAPAIDAFNQIDNKLVVFDQVNWWQTASQRIDFVDAMADHVLDNIQREIERQNERALEQVIYVGLAIFVGIIVAMFLAIMISRSIVNRINVLAAAMKKAETDTNTLPLSIDNKDEISDLSRSFNSLLKERNAASLELRALNADLEKIVQERTEKMRHALDVKNQFLSNMSHEFKTPLNGIMGMLQIIPHAKDDAQRDDFVKLALESGNFLLEMVNETLDAASLESGKFTLELSPFKGREIIDTKMAIFQQMLLDTKIEYIVETNLTDEIYYTGDLKRITQVLNNLMSNAIKFTPSGRITLKIKHTEINAIDSQLFFSVSDNGIGIPSDKLNYVFEKFTQVQEGNNRKYGGTGLGLSIAKDVVAKMGGELKVESAVDVGSTFYFSILLPFSNQ